MPFRVHMYIRVFSPGAKTLTIGKEYSFLFEILVSRITGQNKLELGRGDVGSEPDIF